jgi:hypothetical protein
MRRVFVSHSFAESDRALVGQIDTLLRSHGLVPTTGRSLGGGALTPEIKKRIDETDGLIALFTRRDAPDPTASHPWVHSEFGYVRLGAKRAVGVYETGVVISPSDQGNEHVDYDPNAPLQAFLRLSELIGEWKRQAGRSFKVQVLPEAMAKQLGAMVDNLTCEYRVLLDNSDTPWTRARVIREVAGLFVHVRVPDDAQMVQVRTTGPVASESDYTPLWMPILLQPRA